MELCQLILLGICVLAAEKVETSRTTAGQHAVVTQSYARIEIDVPDEMVPTPDWTHMPYECDSSNCISYYKHCDLRQTTAICNYWFTDVYNVKFGHIRISANSIRGLSNAEWAARVQTKRGRFQREFPLSELEVLGANAEAAFLRH
jgi:hypothetical protein